MLGLGETTLLHACTLGRRLGLIAIHPAFIAHHAEQVARYGLSARVVGIRSMHPSTAEHMAAFADPARKAVLRQSFEDQARLIALLDKVVVERLAVFDNGHGTRIFP